MAMPRFAIADEVIDLLLPVAFYRVRLARLRRLAGTGESDVMTVTRPFEPAAGSLPQSVDW